VIRLLASATPWHGDPVMGTFWIFVAMLASVATEALKARVGGGR
jgi:hypothetical protein